MLKCKFYSEEVGKCLFDGPPDECPFGNKEEECACFRPIEENKEEFKDMKKCKFYAETARRGWCSNVDCLLEHCYFDDNFNSCELFDPTEYEKESSSYNLNSTEINVFSKLFKEYIKDHDKLEKLVETFESYLSNASKSPANAEGKCSDEGTFYRVMKGRIENKEESEVVKKFKENLDQIISVRIEHIGVGDLKECRFVQFARVIDNCLGNFIVIDCTTDKVYTYSYAEYSWKEVPREASKVKSLDDKVRTEKLTLDNSRSMDTTTLTIQNCDKIILKPKSLEVEVKIEKDNFDDFDYIVVNGHKFKKV